MRTSVVIAILVGFRAAVATATPVATSSAPGCGHMASTAYGPVAYCNQVKNGIDAGGLASGATCVFSPDVNLPIIGPAVAYAGSSVSNDGAGTFQFFGGPQVSTAFGPTSYGEQRRGSGCGATVRWGNFNFVVGKFFPGGDWLPDTGQMSCRVLNPPPACIDPFTDAGWIPERTDQGVDYGAAQQLPVRAICDGTILSTANVPGWPGYTWLYYKLTSGPFAGKCVYVAENLVNPLPVGTHVKAGQVIATALPGGPGTEWGWAQGIGTPSVPYGSLPDGTPTEGGKAFARFLRSLDAPTLEDPGAGPSYAGASCP